MASLCRVKLQVPVQVNADGVACVGGHHPHDGESASDAIGGVSCEFALREIVNRHATLIALWSLQVSGCVAA
jgi:hypothetical protein